MSEYIQHTLRGEARRFNEFPMPNLGCMIRKTPYAAETMHAACFVGHRAIVHGLATVDEILGDYGLVHELAHIREFGEGVSPCAGSIEEISRMADNLVDKLKLIKVMLP